VRATLKTFKKNYHEEYGAASCRDMDGKLIGRVAGYGGAASNFNLNDRIKLLMEENTKQRGILKEKIYELDALTSKYRKIQSMIQSGQYYQAMCSSGGPMGAASPAATLTAEAQQCGLAGKPTSSVSASQLLSTSAALGSSGLVGALGGGSTTMLLTSRSPLRERVSFSASRGLESGGLTMVAGESIEPRRDAGLLPKLQAEQQQQQQQSAAKAQGAQFVHQPQTERPKSFGLRSSPLMSSATFITTTNTTSSTNNATDITTDYTTSTTATTNTTSNNNNHSAKLLSAGASSSVVGSISANELGERVGAISRQVAAANQQSGHLLGRLNADGQPVARLGKGEKESSLTKTHERLLAGSAFGDDMSLFNILSCINSATQTGQLAGQLEPNSKQQRAPPTTSSVKENIGRWLEGPFCTVMLRQKGPDASWSAPEHRPEANGAPELEQSSLDVELETGANWVARPSGRPKQWRNPVPPPTKSMLMRNVRKRKPRSLSMIEYLGLSEFDLIARRHERILRYTQAQLAGQQVHRAHTQHWPAGNTSHSGHHLDKTSPSNADLHRLHHMHHMHHVHHAHQHHAEQQQHCHEHYSSCCALAHHGELVHGSAECWHCTEAEPSNGCTSSEHRLTHSNSGNNLSGAPLRPIGTVQSDWNLLSAMSEPAERMLDEERQHQLIHCHQFSVSCSTCCSWATQTYVSQSEIIYRQTMGTSSSSSTGPLTDSNGRLNSMNNSLSSASFSSSGSSSSPSGSTSLRRSSSMNVATPHEQTYGCPHQYARGHHHEHHAEVAARLESSPGGSSETLSEQQSAPLGRQTTETGPHQRAGHMGKVCHHQQRLAFGRQTQVTSAGAQDKHGGLPPKDWPASQARGSQAKLVQRVSATSERRASSAAGAQCAESDNKHHSQSAAQLQALSCGLKNQPDHKQDCGSFLPAGGRKQPPLCSDSNLSSSNLLDNQPGGSYSAQLVPTQEQDEPKRDSPLIKCDVLESL